MPRIDLMLFPEGKSKALTFSYDDGTIHDKKLLQMMNDYKVKGTFNMNGGILNRNETAEIDGKIVDISTVGEDELIDLYRGHEIAAHGFLHASLPTLASGSITYEVIKDRERLEEITGEIVRGFAYPFGTYNETVKSILKTSDIEYARTVKSTYNFELPEDFLEWNPTCHYNDLRLMELADKFCKEPSFFLKPEIFYIWGHSYEFVQNENWDVLNDFLSFIQHYRDDIWFATNIEIVDYIKAYRQLKYSADGKIIYNPASVKLWIIINMEKLCIKPGETLHLK